MEPDTKQFIPETKINPAPFSEEQIDTGSADQMLPMDKQIPISSLEDTLSQKWWFNSLPDNMPYKKALQDFYTGSANGLNAELDYNKVMENFKGVANAANLLFKGVKTVGGSVIPDLMKYACYDFSDGRKLPGGKYCPVEFPDNSKEIAEIEAKINAASGEKSKIQAEWDAWKRAYDNFDATIDARLAQMDSADSPVHVAELALDAAAMSATPDIEITDNMTDSQLEEKMAQIQTQIATLMNSKFDAYSAAVNNAMDQAASDLTGQAKTIMLNLMADSQAMDVADQAIEDAQDAIVKLMPPVPSKIFEEMIESGTLPEMSEPLEMPIPSLLGKNKINWWLWMMDQLIKNLRTKLLQELIYRQIIKPLIECGKLMIKLAQALMKAAVAVLQVIRGVVEVIAGINSVIGGFSTTIEGAAEIASAGTDPFTAVPKIVDGGLKVKQGLEMIKGGFETIKSGFNHIKSGFKNLVNALKDAFSCALKIGQILIKLHITLNALKRIQWIKPDLLNPIIPGDFPVADIIQTFLDPELTKTDDEQREGIDLPDIPVPPPGPAMENKVMQVLTKVAATEIKKLAQQYGVDKLYDILPNQGY